MAACDLKHKKSALHSGLLELLSLVQWLRDNAGLTTQLVEEVLKPYTAQHAQNLLHGTTWNEAAR